MYVSKFFPTSAIFPQCGQQMDRVPLIFCVPLTNATMGTQIIKIPSKGNAIRAKRQTSRRKMPRTVITMPTV